METEGVGRPLALIGFFAALFIIYFSGNAIHRLYIDPLSKIPGPKINALSRVPYIRNLLAGTTVQQTVDLHKRYGDVVRISPNELSFTSIDTAFSDIYGFRTGKLKSHLNMQKDPIWYSPPTNGSPSILSANDEGHAQGRRLLSHAFSDRALSEQEPLIQGYVDQLVNKLKEVTSANEAPVNIVKWYNWTTFDVIADLLFGEPFGCLQDLSTHKYVDLLFKALTAARLFYVLHHYPWMKWGIQKLISPELMKNRVEYSAWIASQTKKRMARETARSDFMTHIMNHNVGEKAMSQKSIESNCQLFVTAGSETTATLLSGATYLLLKNPDKFQRLKDEVRGEWSRYDEITVEAVTTLPYLHAVLSEALRYYPPVPVGFERLVGPGGEVVSGYFIPEGTSLSVSHFAAYHSAANFTDPDSFVPERWMGDERYANDKRAWCQPFSFGPRNCLGKNLAWAEMRLILAKMVWSFDLELEPRSRDWIAECRVMALWQKPELAVKVREVVRA